MESKMRIQSELCHTDGLRTIVKITGWIDNRELGSALGEG